MLGTYSLNNNSSITLSNAANGYVIADGIKLVPITQENNEHYYYHNDHLGTPQLLTDENANIVWQANYAPFGKATLTIESITNNIRFPGQYYDQESGLHYNYFRDYDPELGAIFRVTLSA